MQASRVKGSARQLFGREEGNSDEFEIRPSASRKIDGMATLLGDLHEFAHDIICRNIDGEVTIPKVVYNESIDAVNEFQQQYMGTCGGTQCPCLLTGSTIRADWPAGELCWSPKTLLQSIGGSTRVEMKGANATVTFEAFVAYMKSSECADDDDPCYLWETLDENDQIHFFLISKFIVPRHFRGEDEELVHGCHVPGDTTDLLSFAGEDGLMFGLHRWLLIGSKRSGSSLHIDPLFSSAWNTLLLGTKLWCIIPPSPHAERLILEVMELVNPCNKEVYAAWWFAIILPSLSAAYVSYFDTTIQQNGTMDKLQLKPPQCFLQCEGETIYIPAGWYHAVLNLNDTVCVTQNFCEHCNCRQVCQAVYQEDAFPVEEKLNWRERVLEAFPTADMHNY